MTPKKIFRLLIASSLLLLPSVTFPRITPDIITAHERPGPVITQDANGRDHIAIRAADFHGISHNQYEAFHVSEQGVVFNNQTVAADIIFNEVIGTGLSKLNGIMEVAGKTADVIVSNPNGIDCNGCAFMNSLYGILTTGKFVFERDALIAMNVNSGHITVGEKGMIMYGSPAIARGKIDLIAGGVTINGKIRSEIRGRVTDKEEGQSSDGEALAQIRIIAGRNKVSQTQANENSYVTEYYENEQIHNEKIDVGMLGGMYSGQIYLYGSKAGIGVHSHAVIQGVENLVIDSMGTLTLNASVSASNNIEIRNASEVVNHGKLTAAENFRIKGVQHVINGSELEKRSEKFSAATVRAKNIDISVATLSNYGSLLSEYRMHLDAGEKLRDTGQHISMKTAETQESKSEHHYPRMNKNTLKNYGEILSQGDIVIRAPLFSNDIYNDKESNESIPLIYAEGNLSVDTLQGSNLGGILSSQENLVIRSMDGTASSGLFNNQAVVSYQDEYTKFSGVKNDILVDRKAIKSSGGFIFSGNDITINLKSFLNQGALYNTLSDDSSFNYTGKVYANNKININVDEFKNTGGEINGDIVNIIATEAFSNVSGAIYGFDNLITTKKFLHKTKIHSFDEGNYIEFAGKKGLIKSENTNKIIATDDFIVSSADIISTSDLEIDVGKKIKISSKIIEKKLTTQSKTHFSEDGWFKVYSVDNEKKIQRLTQESIIPIIKSDGNIALISHGHIEFNGAKIYGNDDIFIKNTSGDIEFKPFYLIDAERTEEDSARNVKILGGIKTWEENKYSVNANLNIGHLTSEVFFGKHLSINAPEGTVYIGETDFAFMEKERQADKGKITLSAKEIKSDIDQISKKSSTTSHDTSLGFRIEAHSSVVDAIDNVSKKMEVQGGRKAYVKASVQKGAQVAGELSNIALGDTAGGSAQFVRATTDTINNKNNVNDGISVLYADDIFLTATGGDIDLKGTDLLSRNSEGFIQLDAQSNVKLGEASNMLTWDSNKETQEVTLGAVANSNLLMGSAGLGVRAGYNNSNQKDVATTVRFVPFNVSARRVSIKSGQDTLLYSGKITAGAVDFDTTGSLKIETAQDTDTEETQEGSFGGGIGLDINTYTAFGINGDIHGDTGHSESRAALSTQQSGVFAKSISGTVRGDLWLTGAYLIGHTPEDELNVYGNVCAKTVEDIKNKEGFFAGAGIGIGVDGRPMGNINYSSPEFINYQASQLPTLSGVTVKNHQGITGNLNSNKNELMKIIQNDKVGNIEIKGTFAFSGKKNNRENKKAEKNPAVHYDLTPHEIHNYAVPSPSKESLLNGNQPFRKNGKSYIRVDENHFEVNWDTINQTWRIISPLYGVQKPRIPVVWHDERWQVHSSVGLRGGGNELQRNNTPKSALFSRLVSVFNRKSRAKGSAQEDILSQQHQELSPDFLKGIEQEKPDSVSQAKRVNSASPVIPADEIAFNYSSNKRINTINAIRMPQSALLGAFNLKQGLCNPLVQVVAVALSEQAAAVSKKSASDNKEKYVHSGFETKEVFPALWNFKENINKIVIDPQSKNAKILKEGLTNLSSNTEVQQFFGDNNVLTYSEVVARLKNATRATYYYINTPKHAMLLSKNIIGIKSIYHFYDPNFAIYSFSGARNLSSGLENHFIKNGLSEVYKAALDGSDRPVFNVRELDVAGMRAVETAKGVTIADLAGLAGE